MTAFLRGPVEMTAFLRGPVEMTAFLRGPVEMTAFLRGPVEMTALRVALYESNSEARRWRPLRTKFSPIFTSGKIREMFPLILECAENLEQCLEKIIEKGGFMDCHEVAARFFTDIIGSCVFGINMNALSDEECEFRKIGRKIFDQNSKSIIRVTFRENFPWLYNFLWFLIPRSEITKFATKLVADIMKYREENNIVRPDFLNMLMELKKHEKLEDIELTDTILAAQAFIFFAAGFETSSTTISHALYEMALNPDIQDKLRKEIIEFYVKTNGNLKYEQIKEMKYLDKILKETLRKYSAAAHLRRRCNADYTFSGTKVTIPKGTEVLIPVYAIQRDSNIYPDPEKFDPERFNEDAVAARHLMCYLPFGDGPRNCIGARFAIYQTKIGLIKILHKFKVDVCEKTITTYVHDPNSFILFPNGGIHLKLSKVEN
ncbi:cytochrome P450 6a2-like [Bombus pascuorum]|uniref:cytochrome P450 6a2-like n=1 Tax=Bombus pascuorum TaxID=65598 RepID=UPI00298D9E3A|nr:cytochrome P450 6a2-like [Bombus pascuorum]